MASIFDEDYKSPYGMEDEEVAGLKRTLGGTVTENDGSTPALSRLAGAAARLLEEKKDLIDSGKTRKVYRWKKDGNKVVKPYWLKAEGETRWVAVRPCGEDFGGKTFLGLLVGEVALSVSFTEVGPGDEAGTQVVELEHTHHNPLILIPELGKTVFGCESWWGEIKGPEGLKKITNQDVNSVWYVQALKALTRSKVDGEG